jgi:hypothetical protein
MTDRIVMSGIIASMAALTGIGTDGPPWPFDRRPRRGGFVGWGSKAQRPADADERRKRKQRAQKAARKAQRGQR